MRGKRGWVYIITNKAMPGLIKVGYTMKDPDLRAEELNHTGSPYPYEVAFEVFVENPKAVEQRVHSTLKHALEGKEWFRCELQAGIRTVREIVGDAAIMENVRSPEGAATIKDKSEAKVMAKGEEEVKPTGKDDDGVAFAEVPRSSTRYSRPSSNYSQSKDRKSQSPVEDADGLNSADIKFSSTRRYSTNCRHCGETFSVTLTRHDAGARCPKCRGLNEIRPSQ